MNETAAKKMNDYHNIQMKIQNYEKEVASQQKGYMK